MSRPLRFVDLRERHDTTRTAALLTVEQGVPPLAFARARARAQYAIAMWTVLAPPEGRKVLPDLGMWVPQPLVHCPQRHRSLIPLEGGAPQPSEEGGGYNDFGMFVLPAEDELRLPFEAMAHTDRRGAQAVLSASFQLMAGGRASRLQPSERARALMAAVESLGEQPSGKNARPRFVRLMQRHGTDHAMEARGWGPDEIRRRWSAWSRRGTSPPTARMRCCWTSAMRRMRSGRCATARRWARSSPPGASSPTCRPGAGRGTHAGPHHPRAGERRLGGQGVHVVLRVTGGRRGVRRRPSPVTEDRGH